MGILPLSHTFAKKNILGMSDNEVILDLQQQRLERAIGFELTNTQLVIKRSGVFDEVDKRYGIPEEERAAVEANAQPPEGGAGGGMGGGAGSTDFGMGDIPETGGVPAPAGAPAAGAPAAEPLSESRKDKILSQLGNVDDVDTSFDMNKAKQNIYEIETKLNEILSDNR
jgi:hypothetical protein